MKILSYTSTTTGAGWGGELRILYYLYLSMIVCYVSGTQITFGIGLHRYSISITLTEWDKVHVEYTHHDTKA